MNAYDYLRKKRDALLMASGQFWLPSGMSQANVLAAYIFKGVASESDALKDITGNGYNLTKSSQTYNGNTYSPTWSASNSFTFSEVYQGLCGYLNNASLNTQDIKCMVVRFSDLSLDNRGYLITAGGSAGTAQLMAACTYSDENGIQFKGAGFASIWGVANAGTPRGHWDYADSVVTSGVLGLNCGSSGALYKDGSLLTVTRSANANSYFGTDTSAKQGYTFGNSHADISDLNNARHAGKKIQCAVFFSVALTTAQHKEVAERMAII